MKCIYINLDRISDRREWMQKQADLMGLSFERVPAIDVRDLSDAEIKAIVGTASRDLLPSSAVACFLSHRKAWEIAANPAAAAHTAIFEDDVHFSGASASFLSSDGWVPADADIIRLEVYRPHCAVEAAHIRTIGNRRLHRLRGTDAGSSAYVISRECAQRLLRDVTMIPREFDQVLFNPESPIFSSLKTYKLIPALCVQDRLHNQEGVPGQSFAGNIDRVVRSRSEKHKPPRSKIYREAMRLLGNLRRAAMIMISSKATIVIRARYR